MKILQIGAGFIGVKTSLRLQELGHSVALMSRSTGFDIKSRKLITNFIERSGADMVLLMSAVADLNVFEANPEEGLDVNMGGLINVALACAKNKIPLCYISTCCAYGNTPELPSTEESVCNPSEIYAATKLAGEWICKGLQKSYGLQTLILRIATCYGPNMRKALAPAVFINQMLRSAPITIHGDGKQTRTLTYVDDEVEGICQAINSGIKAGTYNISSEEELSVLDWVKIIGEELHRKPVLNFINDRRGQTFRELISSEKARKHFGWKAKVNFREGIKRTLDWMDKNNLKEIK